MESSSAPRAGFVTLVGPANAGKSTLMNRLVGEPLSIVTPKAQTTWRRVAGILTNPDAQIIFLDTPGLVEPKDLVHRALLGEVRRSVADADVLVIMVDGSQHLNQWVREQLRPILQVARAPVHLVLNKCDTLSKEELTRAAGRLEADLGLEPHPISALDGSGVEELLRRIRLDLPEGPFLYPEDEIAIEPVRFFVSEMVREALFELYEDEIPWGCFTRTEDFREGGERDRTYVQVTIHVERASQKGIIIGSGGRAIRRLGTQARARIEHFLGEPVYLDLWVKVLPRWRKRREQLKQLGLKIPDDDATP